MGTSATATQRLSGALAVPTLLVLLAVVLLYLAAASYGPAVANDPAAGNAAAWNLATQQTPIVPESWADRREVWATPAREGAAAIDRFPGVVAWLTPAYALADAAGVGPVDPDDPLTIPAWPGSLTAAVTAAGAIALLFGALRRLVGDRVALGASTVVALGTPMLSVAADAAWPHALSVGLVALGLRATVDRRLGMLALAVGANALSRPHVALGQAVAAVSSPRTGWLRPVMAAGVGLLLGLAALSWYSSAVFDTWWPAAGYAVEPVVSRGLTMDPRFLLEQTLGAWLHPSRGVLVLTPVLLVLLPWLPTGWRHAPRCVRSAAVGGLVVLLVQYRLMPFTGGSGFFGYRTSLEGLALALPLLTVTWQQAVAPRVGWRRLGLAAIAVGFVVHAYGAFVGASPPVQLAPQ